MPSRRYTSNSSAMSGADMVRFANGPLNFDKVRVFQSCGITVLHSFGLDAFGILLFCRRPEWTRIPRVSASRNSVRSLAWCRRILRLDGSRKPDVALPRAADRD